ncbi:hypothetical protein [Luteipulveratus flavus]|uniref:DUF2567 domain-containing protein n=1 Tax=Luteipulveratus flavus TaxID=3031728 RepID=A0ABT6C9A4_9MICO|nr:hypothetical protein [Luteipulveratus sp. YIM 133296]MDF8265311.1 hypothetical protein [Luteipulveratus sp. YIM 133296]
MIRARAGAAAATAAVLAVVLHVLGSFAGYEYAKNPRDVSRDLDLMVLRRIGEIPWPFGNGFSSSTMQLAFVAAILLVGVLTWLLTFATIRVLAAGSRAGAVLLGTWAAVILATVAGKGLWTSVYVTDVLQGRNPDGAVAAAITSAPWWGVLVGWLPALAATAAYAATNRGRAVTAPYQPAWQPDGRPTAAPDDPPSDGPTMSDGRAG